MATSIFYSIRMASALNSSSGYALAGICQKANQLIGILRGFDSCGPLSQSELHKGNPKHFVFENENDYLINSRKLCLFLDWPISINFINHPAPSERNSKFSRFPILGPRFSSSLMTKPVKEVQVASTTQRRFEFHGLNLSKVQYWPFIKLDFP